MSKKEQANDNIKNSFNNIKILIKLFFSEEEIKQKMNDNSAIPQVIDYDMVFIKKNLMNKYKEIMNYKDLLNFIKSNNDILNCITLNKKINYNNLNDSNILKIINQMPKDLINKIENVDKKKLITELKVESMKEWKFNYEKIKREKEFIVKYLEKFEIINNDILNSFKTQDVEITDYFYGDCIFGDNKVFFVLKDKNWFCYQIGFFEKSGIFTIEYLFMKNEIEDSSKFIKDLSKIGIKKLIQTFKEKEKEKKVQIGNKDINFVKVSTHDIIVKHNPKGGLILAIPSKISYNKHKEIRNKIKALALLSIFLKKAEEIYNNIDIINHNKDDLYLLNAKFLENPFYKEVNKFIIENELIQKKLKDIKINDLSLDYMEKMFTELNENKLKELESNNILKKNENITGPFEPKIKLIPIGPKKYLEVYVDFVIITKRILIELTNIFHFNVQKQSFNIDSFNENELIKINNFGKMKYGFFINNNNEANERLLDEKIINNETNNNMGKIIELMEKLENKEKELKELKSKLPFELNKDEKIMNVIIRSNDQRVLFPIICKNTDLFIRLESELYKVEEYKNYKEEDNYFLINGNKINKYNTLEENGIKNNDIILLVKLDNDF